MATKAVKKLWPQVVWSPLSPTGVEQAPDPELPGPRWLRVSNRQCGICASDLMIFFMNGDQRAAPVALPSFSRIYLGHEAVGVVSEVGPEVKRFKVGDRAVLEARPWGSPNCFTQELEIPCEFCARGDTRLCENRALRSGPTGKGSGWADSYTAHETEVWPVPDEFTDDQAAMIEPMAVAVHAVLRRRPLAGEKVLVLGSGITGLLVLQALKALAPESHVTSVVRYEHQGAAAERFGANEVISDQGDLYAKAARITNAKYYRGTLNRGMLLGGYDVIFDCVGNKYTQRDSLRLARAGGTVVLIGLSLDQLKLDPTPIWFQEVDLIGSMTFGMEHLDGREVHTYDLVIEMLQEGALSTEKLITHRFPFADYQKAIRTAQDKRTGSIKVMLTF